MAAKQFYHDVDLNRSSLKQARLHPVAGTGGISSPLDGQVAYDTQNGSRLVNVYDSQISSWVQLMRRDYNWTITGLFTFNPAAGAPFAVGSSTLVSNLNAQYISGYGASQSASGNTVAVRNSDGTLTVADGTSNGHAVNLGQLNAAVRNRIGKDAVKAATTAALATNTIAGNVITASANGAFSTVDGVTINLNDSVLVLHESDADASDNEYMGTSDRRNGCFTLTQVGDGSNPWKLTRRNDSDADSEQKSGSTYFVDQGTQNVNSEWTIQDDVTLTTNGSDGTTVTLFKSGGNTLYKAGNGMVLVGNKFHFATSSNYSAGSLFYASSTTAVGQINAVATGNVLLSAGTGTVPAWGKVDLQSHISSILLLGNGGTGADLSGGANGGIAYKNGTALALTSALTGILKGNGSSAPTAVAGTSGTLVKWGSNTIVDSLLSESGTVLTIASSIAHFGSLATGLTYIREDTLNFAYNTNGSYEGSVNWVGYQAGTTQFRDFGIYNGKSTIIARFAGSDKLTTLFGGLTFNGAQTIQTSSGILSVTGTGGLALSTSGNTNATLGVGSGVFAITAASVTASYLTSKSILFAGTGGALTQDNSYFQYDSASVAFAVGQAADSQVTGYFHRTGPKTVESYGLIAQNDSTSSTNNKSKFGLWVYSSGTWNGTGAINAGIWIDTVTGGTTNWAFYNNSGANVYLGSGTASVATLSVTSSASIASATLSGTTNLSGLTASRLLQLDGSKNIISSNDLPSGSTIGSLALTRIVTADVGDGSNTSITVTHNLGTKNLVVWLRQVSDDTLGECSVTAATTNTVTLVFTTAPTSAQFKAIVIG